MHSKTWPEGFRAGWPIGWLKLLGVSALLLAASGCATLTTSECRVVDWSELGRQDGAAGRAASRVAAHQSACEKSGRAPNIAAYEAGRRAGLTLYCTPEGVYESARRGRRYEGVCETFPPALQTAYDRGRAYDAIRRRINDLEAWRYDYPFPLRRYGQPWRRSVFDRQFDDFFYWSEIRRLERRLQSLEGPYPP